MTPSLAALRKKTEPMRIRLRRDRVTPPGLTRELVIRTHPVKLAQRRRDYRRAQAALVRHYSPDDQIGLVQPPRKPREAVEGINTPAAGETWADLEAFRARYGLPPVNTQ